MTLNTSSNDTNVSIAINEKSDTKQDKSQLSQSDTNDSKQSNCSVIYGMFVVIISFCAFLVAILPPQHDQLQHQQAKSYPIAVIIILLIIYILSIYITNKTKPQSEEIMVRIKEDPSCQEEIEALYAKWGAVRMINLQKGHIWTLITHSFIHFRTDHLSSNLMMYVFAGFPLNLMIGQSHFCFLYLSTSIGAALAHLAITKTSQSLNGSSGAVYGILSAYCTILMFGIYEFQQFTITAVFISNCYYCIIGIYLLFNDIIYMFCPRTAFKSAAKSVVAHIAHISGFTFGVLYILAFYKPDSEKLLDDDTVPFLARIVFALMMGLFCIMVLYHCIFSKKFQKKIACQNNSDCADCNV